MDAPSHSVFGLERKKGQWRQMTTLRLSTGQHSQVCSQPLQCHYMSEYREDPEMSGVFFTDLVSKEKKKDLEIPAEELYAALQNLQSGVVLQDLLACGW